MLGPDFGSNHGSFSDVAGVSFRIEKSAPRRIMRSAPKHREIGFQETAGFGKTAGCLKNQGFWACRDLPEIRIWERNKRPFDEAYERQTVGCFQRLLAEERCDRLEDCHGCGKGGVSDECGVSPTDYDQTLHG